MGFSKDVQAQSGLDTLLADFGNPPDSLFEKSAFSNQRQSNYLYAYKGALARFTEKEGQITAHIQHLIRIKVLTEKGKKAALVGIPYYFKNGFEEVRNIRGYTYTGNGKRVRLNSSSVKTINVNERYNIKEFRMPEVEKGALLEYRYKVERSYIEELPDFYFSHQVPTLYAQFTLVNPRFLRYKAVHRNLDDNLNYQRIRVDTSDVPKVFTIPQPEPLLIERWWVSELPAVKKVSFGPSFDTYRGQLKFQLTEFGIPRQPLENSWEIVAARIRKSRNPLDPAISNSRFDSLGRSIASHFNGRKAIQDSVFRYVNATMNYNNQKAAYTESGPRNVLNGEPSNQASINQVLLGLLRSAGIDAWPLLLSTTGEGQLNRNFPSPFQFNSMIVYSEIKGRKYFMDASYPFSQPNLIPVETYNEQGMVLTRDDYKWVDINPGRSIFGIQVRIDGEINSRGVLSGTLKSTQKGYPARLIREKAGSGMRKAKIVKNSMLDGYQQVTFDSVILKNVSRFDQPVKIDASFTIKNYAKSYTSGLEFNPMVVGYLRNNPFSSTRRDLPVTLDAPEDIHLAYSIAFPENYRIEQGKSSRKFGIPGAELEENYHFNKNVLKYNFGIRLTRKRFNADHYPELRLLYKRWVKLSRSSWYIESD